MFLVQSGSKAETHLILNGLMDYYLMVFDQNGQQIWSTYENSGGFSDINFFLSTKKTLAFNESNHLYFSAEISDPLQVDFVDPGLGSYFLFPDGDLSTVPILTEFRSVTFEPVWRTALFENGLGEGSRVETLTATNFTLAAGGSSFDASLMLQSADPELYSEEKTSPINSGNPEDFSDGFLALFNTPNRALVHSTYFNGSGADSFVSGAVKSSVLTNDHIFFFGQTATYYDPEDLMRVGIPIFNNGLPSAYYQENLSGNLNLNSPPTDCFMFSFCISGTPLNTDDNQLDRRDRNVLVYPNPSSFSSAFHNLTVSAPFPFNEISIFNIQGKLLWNTSLSEYTTAVVSIPAKNFASGIYVIQVSGNYMTLSTKWILSK